MTITIDELKQTIKDEIEERKKQSSFDVSELELFVRLLNQLDTSAERKLAEHKAWLEDTHRKCYKNDYGADYADAIEHVIKNLNKQGGRRVSKYRKKPVVIEAFMFWVEDRPDWFCDEITKNNITTYERGYVDGRQEIFCEIKTLEGVMRGEVGDYIIKGAKGEIYPCKADIFKATYERIE